MCRSQQEMAEAVSAVQRAVARGEVRPQDVTAELLAEHLYTQASYPCPPCQERVALSHALRMI